MIKVTDNKHPTYTHECDEMDKTHCDRIYDEHSYWQGYMGWTMEMDYGRDYPDEIHINFCPFCGEKLPSHQPQEPD